MNRTLLAAPIVLTLACAPPAPTASVAELRAAIPIHAWVDMSIGALPPPGQVPPPAMCAPIGASTFGAMTHQIAGTADGVLADVLAEVAQITAQPPAATQPGHAAWGPIVGASAVYRLTAAQTDATRFEFDLAGKPPGAGEAAWKSVFGGATIVTDAQHREGEIAVDFGVMHALDPKVDPSAGVVNAHFKVDGGARDVAARFTGIASKNAPQPNDSAYAFELAADQSAGFAFTTRVDFDHDGALDEQVHIDSRWATDGSGTAHITVTGGSLGQRTINAIECWNPARDRVYYTADDTNERTGEIACCAY